MKSVTTKVSIGYSLTPLVIAAGLLWLVWSEATKPVIDSWLESGTIVDFVEHERSSLHRGSASKIQYFIDVDTGDGEIVRVPAGTHRPTIGKRVKVQWLEYEDGSVAARLARKKSTSDPYSLNNI